MCKNDKIDELYIKLGQYIQIVDRLKKRIEELELETNYTHPNGTPCTVALNELQKILEGEE